MNEICDKYERKSFYGYRKIHAVLRRDGFMHNIKQTKRLMRFMGLRVQAKKQP